ncbi:MAG: NAD(P)H-quinone oxidoreductase [Actinobacteria bacterium]|nr:NAD(P)H-quinone oxidoreductase [Actinomycetota bacterium]
MRAVVLRSHGGPEVLRLEDVPDPVGGPEDLVVDVVATALNRGDLLQREGRYPQPGPRPEHEIPGLEFAGIVRSVGSRVSRWAIGDAVMGIVVGGGYAERVVVHERQAIAVPAGVTVADAAAIPEVWLTAWDALILQGGLAPGGTALVHAGASGVGTAAIQLARATGAQVVVTCSAGKVARCLELGATAAVDHGSGDFVATVAEVTGGVGADVVLDVVGGEYLARNIDALAVGGRLVQVGVMGEPTATLPLARLLPKRAHLIGTVLRPRPLEEKAVLAQRFGREVVPRFVVGTFVPVIDRRFPLEAIADAHRYLETNASVGKVLVDIG